MKNKGFSLTELIITMLLVIILSLVSMPLYKARFSNQAKLAEGYALLGAIRDAQFKYYSEYGYFYSNPKELGADYTSTVWTSISEVLGINAINNKYFSAFNPMGNHPNDPTSPYKYKLTVIVGSAKAGSITQEFNLRKRSEPIVNNINTSLQIE